MLVKRDVAMVAVGVVFCLLWVGCQAPQRVSLERPVGMYGLLAAADQGQQHPLCPFGVPKHEEGWDHGDTVLVDRPGYLLEHSSVDKIPLWVCERVKRKHLTGAADRDNCRFKPDPRLSPGERAELSDYRSSGYDRGHQAPAGDYKSSQERMCDSFSLSNMAPQIGPRFNRGIWRVLEERTRDAVQERGDAFVITGGMFYDPEEEDSNTADGYVPYYAIGANYVAVPTHFYKILVAKNAADEWEAIGFVLENRAYSEYDFEPYIKPIDWIEERAGFNFMPLLDEDDPDLRDRLELNPAKLWSEFRSN